MSKIQQRRDARKALRAAYGRLFAAVRIGRRQRDDLAVEILDDAMSLALPAMEAGDECELVTETSGVAALVREAGGLRDEIAKAVGGGL